jgi:hypothetical protein
VFDRALEYSLLDLAVRPLVWASMPDAIAAVRQLGDIASGCPYKQSTTLLRTEQITDANVDFFGNCTACINLHAAHRINPIRPQN